MSRPSSVRRWAMHCCTCWRKRGSPGWVRLFLRVVRPFRSSVQVTLSVFSRDRFQPSQASRSMRSIFCSSRRRSSSKSRMAEARHSAAMARRSAETVLWAIERRSAMIACGQHLRYIWATSARRRSRWNTVGEVLTGMGNTLVRRTDACRSNSVDPAGGVRNLRVRPFEADGCGRQPRRRRPTRAAGTKPARSSSALGMARGVAVRFRTARLPALWRQ